MVKAYGIIKSTIGTKFLVDSLYRNSAIADSLKRVYVLTVRLIDILFGT